MESKGLTTFKNAKGEKFSFTELLNLDKTTLQKVVSINKTAKNSGSKGLSKKADMNNPLFHAVWVAQNSRCAILTFGFRVCLGIEPLVYRKFYNQPSISEKLVVFTDKIDVSKCSDVQIANFFGYKSDPNRYPMEKNLTGILEIAKFRESNHEKLLTEYLKSTK